VLAAGRQLERRPRSGAEEPPLGIERVEQRVQVVLVGPAPVEEDERAVGLAGSGADPRFEQLGQLLAAQASRGFGSGVRAGSTWSRSCS
jgi:hypothetical protein